MHPCPLQGIHMVRCYCLMQEAQAKGKGWAAGKGDLGQSFHSRVLSWSGNGEGTKKRLLGDTLCVSAWNRR